MSRQSDQRYSRRCPSPAGASPPAGGFFTLLSSPNKHANLCKGPLEMKPRRTRLWLAAWLALLGTAATALAAEPTTQPPNVLFISVDDMNDWVGCLGGYPGIKTPNIQRLADRGLLFTNAHCASPLCCPSRT